MGYPYPCRSDHSDVIHIHADWVGVNPYPTQSRIGRVGYVFGDMYLGIGSASLVLHHHLSSLCEKAEEASTATCNYIASESSEYFRVNCPMFQILHYLPCA
jgi:hypothetical protein